MGTHGHIDYDAVHEAGRSFEAFLRTVERHRDLWLGMAARARMDRTARDRIERAGGAWRLLVLADDWCGDAVNIVPVVAALTDELPNMDLRIVGREDHPGVMDRHLTNGSRSIPVVVLLDEGGEPRGWWGPRPAELQAWFEEAGHRLPTEDRYRELRRWYARDRGRTVAREIADLVACGAASPDEPYRGTRPCADMRAA